MGRTPPGETRERVFRYVRERLLAGAPPTVREVQEAFGFRAVQTAREHLEQLVAEGRLDKQAGRSRGYRLPLQPGELPTVMVPILGRVPAGGLDAAIEDLDGFVPVQSTLEPGEIFGLRVHGESMTGAGILPDDLVIVRRQSTARNGQVVVAMVGDEATVKTLKIRDRQVELHPANPDYRPIVPEPGEVRLLGRVIEVRRRLGR